MGVVGSFVSAVGAGIVAFREAMLNNDPQQGPVSADFAAWSRWPARRSRYALYWGMFQNNVYQDLLLPGLATRYKTQFGLYKHIRHIYNPTFRIVDFFTRSLLGGALDSDAGDGESETSALPILTENEALRPAIASLWKASNWQVNKDLFSRYGACLGDVALKVRDDPMTGEASLEVVHPGHIQWLDVDHRGLVQSYILRETRWDPRRASIRDTSPANDPQLSMRPVQYVERAWIEPDGMVTYQTFLNNEPYAWNGISYEWSAPYGFIPFYPCQHEESGQDWGFNAFHWGLSRFREVDDQSSGLNDQIRKAIRAPKLITGVSNIKQLLGTNTPDATVNHPGPDREAMPYLVAPIGADAKDLVFPLDIAGVVANIAAMNADIEKNFPELLADLGGEGGRVTAEEIRMARQVAAAKVQARRASYDGCLARAQTGAIAIGGMRGYRGYEGFGLEDLQSGRLDHRIGHRPVFAVDPLDAIEEDQAFWTAASTAVTAGVPLEVYLERNGWSEEDLARIAAAKPDLESETEPTAKGGAKTDPASESPVESDPDTDPSS
jgi:hypothetical protein